MQIRIGRQILRHPSGAHAQGFCGFQVVGSIFNQHAAARMYPLTRQQLAQQRPGRLRPQLAVDPHGFDRNMLGEMPVQPEMAHHIMRIPARRIGQQDLATWQTPEQPPQASLGTDHVAQVLEDMRLVQEVLHPHVVMLDHPQQGCSVTLPVCEAHCIHSVRVGSLACVAEHPCHKCIHVRINRRENRMRRVVQCVVEVEQPNRCRHLIEWFGAFYHWLSGRIMKSRIAVLLIACLILPFHWAYAENNATLSVSALVNVPQRGTLYRVTHQGNTTYLFGTIHVGKPAFFPLEAEVTHALSRASKLVLEIDIRNNAPFEAALQKHGLYTNGDTVERHLSADSMRQLQQELQPTGIEFEQVKRMKPWLLANMLTGLDLERHGYQRNHGIEVFLLSLAGTKTVLELESAEYQMSLFDSMPDAMQEQYLRETLAELRDGNAMKKAQALIEAWANANSDALEKLLRESLQEKTSSSEFMHRVLLDKRNPQMAARIEELLRNEETTFVGVGLLHMVGETGVPTLLRQRGYEVEKLY